MPFPTNLPSYTPFTTPITLAAMGHSTRHKDMERDILAIATKVGINGSADPTSFDYMIDSLFDGLAITQGDVTDLETLIANLRSGATAMASPSITSFANSQHDHDDAAGGGKLDTLALVAGAVSNVEEVFNVFGPNPSQVINASAFADITGATGSFTSQDGGDLLIIAQFGSWKNSNTGNAHYRVVVGSTNVPNATGWRFFWNTLAEHQSHTWIGVLKGLAPGVYTIKFQASCQANSINFDENDTLVCTIVELKR